MRTQTRTQFAFENGMTVLHFLDDDLYFLDGGLCRFLLWIMLQRLRARSLRVEHEESLKPRSEPGLPFELHNSAENWWMVRPVFCRRRHQTRRPTGSRGREVNGDRTTVVLRLWQMGNGPGSRSRQGHRHPRPATCVRLPNRGQAAAAVSD
jgi:hypothetical protein